MKATTITKDNAYKIFKEARNKLKNQEKAKFVPYIPVPEEFEKEYRKIYGDYFEDHCFIIKKL